MTNRIKFVNMQSIYDTLVFDFKIEDSQADKICDSITKHEMFTKSVFHSHDATLFYFRESSETDIKTVISQFMNLTDLSEYAIKDFGQDLFDTYSDNEDIEIEVHSGKISINKNDLYTVVSDDLLNSEQYILQLVSAIDFDDAVCNLVETAFKTLVEITIIEVQKSLDDKIKDMRLMC